MQGSGGPSGVTSVRASSDYRGEVTKVGAGDFSVGAPELVVGGVQPAQQE
jgi:hypothetical protein